MGNLRKVVRSGFIVAAITLFGSVSPVMAQTPTQTKPARYLLVHQVRGSECCSPGSLSALQTEVDTVLKNNLIGYFAIRFDALNGPMGQALHQATLQHPNQIKPALLIEITPELAAAAGVTYPTTPDKWYQAQAVYTLGYEPSDRFKLMDVLLSRYHSLFGSYPELTSAWMMDTPTLNYLHDQYGVKMHQLTREQWGTDSYTLDGGPLLPYPASRQWLFMPDYEATNSAMIVRQTVADPLKNYGDQTNAFTSQPNDYALDGKTFDYFAKLVDQALGTNDTPGFIVLGLENSMADSYQQEYSRQLSWLRQQVESGRVQAADPQNVQTEYGTDQPRIVVGKDLTTDTTDKTFWVTTGRYRVRLLQHQNQWWLTDLRVYDSLASDPYDQSPARQNGFLVAPFVLNTALTGSQPSQAAWWKKPLLPPQLHSSFSQPTSDWTQKQPNALQLPTQTDQDSFRIATDDTQLTLTYQTAGGQQVALHFSPDKIVLEGATLEQLASTVRTSDQFPLTVTTQHQQISLGWEHDHQLVAGVRLTSKQKAVEVTFESKPTEWSYLRDQFYYYFFPEMQLVITPNQSHTIAYVHNRYALAGRNPVRLVFAPRDDRGRPVGLVEAAQVTATIADTSSEESSLPVVSDAEKIKNDDLQFFDISLGRPHAVDVQVSAGQGWNWHERIYFAPNCTMDWRDCLQHPRQSWWFVKAKVQEKTRQFLEL